MSPKLSNRLTIKKWKKKKKKKLPVDNGRAEVLFKLGLGGPWTSPLEPATMLGISTWSLENQAPFFPEHLPHAFLQSLWLLSPEARSTCCQPPDDLADTPREEMDCELGQDSRCAVNPLDLVTAVYMFANSFLQQEMTVRMVQCQFAVPLVLPAIIPEQSCFLLWPLRGVVSQWRPHSLAKTRRVLEGDLASTEMPMVSCVKLGHCGVSKSRVLSHVIGGPRSRNECFLHRGMDGGQLHRKLSNGLVELGWSLPSGDPDKDIFPVPVVISNLRGDAAAHERCISLLCRASSAVVVFCGNLREKEKLLLASWRGMASKLIVIDLSDTVEEENERRVVGFVPQNLEEEMGLPKGTVLSGGSLSEEELADRLRKTLNDLLPDRLRYVTLEAAADIAVEVGMCIDEGAVCKKAMAAAEEVLKGLEHGSAQFREKQLPLQGALWSRLAELEKEESKQIKAGKGVNIQLQIEKRRIIYDQSRYRMTTAMKVFTDALFTTDKMERAFFLNWMKLRLRASQMRQCTLQKPTHDQQEESGGLSQETGAVTNGIDDGPEAVAYGANYDPDDDDSFCTNSTVEEEEWELAQYETQPLDPTIGHNHGEKNELQLGFSQQEPEQELNLEPVVELHKAGDPTENDGLELSCPEEQSEKWKLDPVHADAMQVDLDPGDAAEKIMEEGSSEREINGNGTQSDHNEKINDEWELSNSEGQNTKQEQESNIGQTNQIEKGPLAPVHADAEQVDLELKESAEQNMEPVLAEDDVIEPRPEPLNMDYTENSELRFDISEKQSEQQLNLEPVVELHMTVYPPENDGLESSYSEEQTENRELETNMDWTHQIEKEQLDHVHTDAEHVYLDLEESTEQSLEEGTVEKAATEAGTQTLNMDNKENSGLNFDLSEQQSEPGLNLEPIMELHMAGDLTVNDVQESSYSEEQTEKQKLETIINQIEQNIKGQLDSVHADAEQVDFDLKESAEQSMEPGLAEEEVSEPGPEPLDTEVTENSGLYFDISEQQSEQELNLEPAEERHVAEDLAENDGLESNYSEEQTETQELETNLDQIDQSEKEQLDPVLADAEQVDLDLNESTELNMEEGTTEKADIGNGTQTLNMDYTENSGLHFDLSEQQSEQGLSLEPTMALHMAGDPTENDKQESSYSEEQTEKKKVKTNFDQIEQTEKEQLNPVLADEEPMNADLWESAEQNTELVLTEKEVTEPGPQLLNMDHTQNSGLHFDLFKQQSEQVLNMVPLEEMHIAGNSTLNDYRQELNSSEKQTKKQEQESNMDQIDQSEKGQLDSVLPDAEHVDLSLSDEEYAEQNMEKGSSDKEAIENGTQLDPVNENGRLDSFHADEEQVDLDLIESAEETMEPGLAERDVIEPGPESPNMVVTENNGLHFDPDLPERETFEFAFYETLNEEQNLELNNLENESTDMKPGSWEKKELKPALEEQMDLELNERENMGLEPIQIVQHVEIDQCENRDYFEEQTIDPEISENQSLHLESGATEMFDLNPPKEQSVEQKIIPDQPLSNPTAEIHLDLSTSLEDQAELDPFDDIFFEPDPSALGLEHFLREMGLIFELTHISLGSGSHNVLRLPSLAADLLLYGVPLELMDGDASNIPSCWLGCVLAELKRRLPPVGIKVLTNLGIHCARNAEVFSALFGVDFPRGRRRPTRGVYMLPLWLPNDLGMDMDCDLLIMIDVEGLCSPGLDQKGDTLVHDNEMATVATGLSDVLMHNITSPGGAEFESNLTVIVNALLRTEVCGYTPICELLTQDKGLNSKLQAFQQGFVAEILQTEIKATENMDKPLEKAKSIPCLIGPWQNTSLSEPVDKEYSQNVIELKRNLFEALTKCAAKSEATGLPEFMGRLSAVWEAVKAESFSIGLQNTEVATAFSMLCTELSNWEKMFLEHMESWFVGATKRVIFNNAKALETGVTWDLLSVLKEEARVEVKTEVDQIRSKLEACLIKDDLHKTYIMTYRPNLMSNMNKLQDQVTEEMIKRLERVRENHNSSVHLKSFQTLLEKGQEAKLHTLTQTSKLTKIFLEDIQLEEKFEGVWNNALSNFDFRLTEIDDIAARVSVILRENLINRGLQRHMKKLEDIGKNNTSGFIVHDEHFEFHNRLKHNRRQQWLQAHYVANYIIEEYNQFVEEKSNLVADVSDSYTTEVLENVEAILKANPLENTSTFEVDLKVYLCSFACQDFQEIHDHYIKDSLLAYIKGAKNSYLGGFIYQVRKRDQCQRVARAFTSMVFKPTALDYIYRPLGGHIMEEMLSRDDAQQYLSPQAFNCSLLEELMEEDSFESFLEYLLSYESFSLGRIKKRVVAHLSETTIFEEWRQQRLEEIVGKMNQAVSQKEEVVSGVLSDTKLLLEKVCLNLEKDGDVDVSRDSLDGPLFSITIEWDRFVTCLLEALAEMQLALAQEFSQNVDINQLLHALPIKPQDCLFNRVRGCEKKCPFCRAPCEVGEIDHMVHKALLHRPKGMLSYTCHDSCSLSHTSCPFDIAQDNLFLNKDTDGQSLAYRDYHSLYPDWSISPEEPDSLTPNAYWRYVLVRFNGRFAGEYKCEPAQLPAEWERITKEEALESLNQAFHTEHC